MSQPIRRAERSLLRRKLTTLFAAVVAAALLAGCATTAARSKTSGAAAIAEQGAATARGGQSSAAERPSANGVLKATLSNGLRVVIVRDPLAPVVTQQITYLVGSNQSPAGFPGMAHAQEHMMFRGSPGITGEQLSEISAQLGGSMDAFTANTITSYYFTVPAEDLALTLKIGALRMAAIDDSPSAWQKERGAIEQEVARDNSNPLYVLQAKAQAHIFAGTPYAHTGLGTVPSFNKTTAAMIKRFWDAWYAPNNALLVVAGDVQPEKVLSEVKRLYGTIPAKKLPAKAKITLSPLSPETFSSKSDQPYGIVAYAFRMPGYRSGAYPVAELLAASLDSQRGTIADLSYEGKALDSGFSYNALVGTGYGYAWAAFPPGASEKEMAAALKRAVEKGVSRITPGLLAGYKRQALLGNALRRNSVAGLARAWTNAVALEGLSSPNENATRLQSVTAGEVEKAAARYLDFAHAVTLRLEPTSGSRPAQGGQTFGKPESFASTPSKEVSLPSWATGPLAKLPNPHPLFHPAVFELPNGIKLIVQPVAKTKAVSLFGSVNTDEDLQAPRGEEGVGSMLDDLYDWGPKGMTRTAFEAKMGSYGAVYSVGSGFSLQVLPDYFRPSLELLARAVLHPALPESAFRTQQSVFEQGLAGQTKSPFYHFSLAMGASLLPKGDPALRRPTPASIRALTLAEVRSYEAKVMRPDETTIVVMGDVKPERVKSLIEKDFGAWTATGPKPDLHYPPIPLSHSDHLFVSDSFRQQDEVVLAETIDSSYRDPGHYALELGNAFLGGGLFASPLYRELRVTRGLVYSVSSSTDFAHARASFRISYGAYPDKVAEARQIAIAQVKAMAQRPLTPRELHLAKASELRQIELTNESLGDVAGSWLAYSSEGLPLDRLYQDARRFERITAPQIEAAFRKYIDPSRLSTFVIGKPVGK